MAMNKNEAVEALRNALDLLHKRLFGLPYFERLEEYPRWRDTVTDTLREAFGEKSQEYRSFIAILGTESWFQYKPTVLDEYFREVEHKRQYQDHLGKIADYLERIILKYQIRRPAGLPQVVKRVGRSSGAWIKAHKILSAIFFAIVAIITLLTTNWPLVVERFKEFLEFFH